MAELKLHMQNGNFVLIEFCFNQLRFLIIHLRLNLVLLYRFLFIISCLIFDSGRVELCIHATAR